MPRSYEVLFEQVVISAAQDLVEVYFGASIYKSLKILQAWLSCVDTTVPPSTFLPVRARILASTVTHGTGGGSAVIKPCDPGDSTAAFTALSNNATTKATTTGAIQFQYDDGFHVYQGFEKMFPRPPQMVGGQGQSFVFELLAVPASFSAKFSGGLLVEEAG